jgi:hypothetical protein
MDKIKGFLRLYFEEVLVSIIIVLVAVSSYFLGRSSVILGATHDPIRVEEARAGEVLGASAEPVPEKAAEGAGARLSSPAGEAYGGQVDATLHGKKYYLPWCTTVAKLAPSAKRHFASVAAAEAAGLTPAKNCAGMNTK